MEEPQQSEQPDVRQHDGEVDQAAVTRQPTSSEQQTPPPAAEVPEVDMDHLTVVSDNTETSK